METILANDGRAIVPALWHLEMANSFGVAERRHIINEAELDECLARLNDLLTKPIETDSTFFSVRATLATARNFRLSAYDAVYLETARMHGLPLATLNRELGAACVKAGVELLD
ncbi:MAG TPA: type II toxin-antitoxin system VapC family toxin [Terriglobales bacterium]